jgi:putative membrane protein
MSSYRSLAVAAALAFAVGCGGGVDRAPDSREGGGGANGVGDDARPTAAERTGATGDSNRGSSMAALSDEDRQFVQKASMSNQMEVTLGNLAEDKAQRDDVKQFGEQLARDHEAANRELQSSIGGGDATTAQQPGGGRSTVAQPSAGATTAQGANRDQNARAGEGGNDMTGGHEQMQQTQQKLERVSGPAFDRAYLEEMVKHHQKDIEEFERASRSDNQQVRAFAERTLPTLRQHLEQAQQLQQSQGQQSQGQQRPGRQ